MKFVALLIGLGCSVQSSEGCLALRSPMLQHLVLPLIWFSMNTDHGGLQSEHPIVGIPPEVHLVNIVLL